MTKQNSKPPHATNNETNHETNNQADSHAFVNPADQWSEFIKLWQSEITALQQSPQALASMQTAFQQWQMMLASLMNVATATPPSADNQSPFWPNLKETPFATFSPFAKDNATFGAKAAGAATGVDGVVPAEFVERLAKVEADLRQLQQERKPSRAKTKT